MNFPVVVSNALFDFLLITIKIIATASATPQTAPITAKSIPLPDDESELAFEVCCAACTVVVVSGAVVVVSGSAVSVTVVVVVVVVSGTVSLQSVIYIEFALMTAADGAII